MKGDFSKSTFRPEKQYDGVRLQQGRVLLDSEWNEQQDILAYLRRTTNVDVIGSSGVPRTGGGFKVIAVADDFILTPGRMYVDGVLLECPAGPPLATAPALVGGNIVLNAWPVDARELRTGRWLEVTGNDGAGSRIRSTYARIATVTPATRQIAVVGSVGLTVIQSVRWVTSYLTQPDVRVAAGTPPIPPPIIAAPGALFYVDVWSRHLTALEEPSIREVALGGPDTSTRTKVVWRVSIKTGVDLCGDPNVVQSDCRLAARSNPAVAPTNVCEVPTSAGYRGVENQLYRVEIHNSGDLSASPVQTPTFKWSRDNGSIAYPIEGPALANLKQVRLAHIGRDERTSLKADDWVELIDDVTELSGRPGQLLQVDTPPDESHRIVTLKPNNITGLDYTARPRLRLWTGTANVAINSDIHLENGVEIRFTGARFTTGDYWTIPARSAFGSNTGDVEWPNNGAAPPLGFPLPPEGIRHAYAPLAVLTPGQPPVVARDCRRLFSPLTDIVNLLYVSGDAQEVMPNLMLPNPRPRVRLPIELRAGVFNGRAPVDGKVRFTVTRGNGQVVDAATGTAGLDIVVTTQSGFATVWWEVDTSGDPTRTVLFPVQTCEAWLLNANGDRETQTIRYHARLSLAEEVAYDPSRCADLTKANANTVQKAIDALCARECGVCTINVRPSTKWDELQKKVDEVERAEICFAAGDYEAPVPLKFTAKQVYLKITGAGDATRIRSAAGDSVFRFDGCGSVIVRDLHLENAREDAAVATLHAADCEHLVLEQLSIDCPHRIGPQTQPAQFAWCVRTERLKREATRLEMRACRLNVGRGQYGMLLDDPDRAFLEDNVIVPIPRTFRELLAEPGMSELLRRGLYRNANVIGPAVTGNVQLQLGTQMTVTFNSFVPVAAWQTAVRLIPPTNVIDLPAAVRYLDSVTNRIMTDQGFREREVPAFDLWLKSVAVTQITGGIITRLTRDTRIRELQIIGNRVEMAILGIHTVVPATTTSKDSIVERVAIARNTVVMYEGPDSVPYTAIWTNRTRSQVIEHNRITGTPTNQGGWLAVGIRVDDPIEGLLMIRENHTERVSVGIAFFARPEPGIQWIVADNLTFGGNNNLGAPGAGLRIDNNLAYP